MVVLNSDPTSRIQDRHAGGSLRNTLFAQNTDTMSSPRRRPSNQEKTPTRGRVRRRVSRVLNPAAAVAAALYFLIDAVFLSAIRTIIGPLARALSRLRIFNALAAWLVSLGPYPTLVLFLVPVIILEPVKPVGAYLIATGHLVSGISLIVIGEVLKIVLVERLFHFSRDKLMTIPAFARVCNWAEAWLAYFRSQPLWQATLRQFAAIKALAGRILNRLKAWITSNARSRRRE
jgi:hypothetical protein